MPKRPNGLEKPTGRHWRFRKTYPAELHEIIGKSAFIKSFGTSDYQEALDRYPLALIEANNTIKKAKRDLQQLQNAQAEQSGKPTIESLSSEEIQSIVLSWFHDIEAELAPRVEEYIGDDSHEENVADGLLGDIEALYTAKFDKVDFTDGWVSKEADKLLEQHSILIDKDSPQYKLISNLVYRGLTECRARLLGQIKRTEYSRDSYFKDIEHASPLPDRVRSNSPKATIKVSDLLTKYLAEKQLGEKTKMQYRQHASRFAEYVGENTPIDKITRDDLVAYRNLLQSIPTNASKRFPDLTFREIAESPKASEYPTLHPRTINKTFESLSTLFGFAEDWQLIPKNPAKKLQLPVDEDDEDNNVRPYNGRELKVLFTAPLYKGCVDDERNYSKEGKSIIRRHRFWIPLIALYTGMRLNEICQLYLEDIKSEREVHYIDIREKREDGSLPDDKSLKNKAAKRVVPIHSELVRAGFLQYVEKLRRQKASRLFPELVFGNNGYSDSFQKWYRRFLTSLGLKDGNRALCFHSFRHTFKDQLQDKEVFPEYRNRICGWTESNSTAKDYGKGPSIEKLAEQVEKVIYPDLDLSHLYL